MSLNQWRRRGLLVAVLVAFAWIGCSDDSGGTGSGDAGNDTGGSDVTTDTGEDERVPNRPQELVGDYDLVSVTIAGNTITTENQELGGMQARADGNLTLGANGSFIYFVQVYEDDVAADSITASGTWDVTDTDVITVTVDQAPEAPVVFNYTYDSGSRILTLDGPDEIGDFVWEK